MEQAPEKPGFIKAMFYENKNGVMAPSLHRFLAGILFFVCLILWTWIIVKTMKIPDTMIYTMWALLGINGFHKTMSVFKKSAPGVAMPPMPQIASTPSEPAEPSLARPSEGADAKAT